MRRWIGETTIGAALGLVMALVWTSAVARAQTEPEPDGPPTEEGAAPVPEADAEPPAAEPPDAEPSVAEPPDGEERAPEVAVVEAPVVVAPAVEAQTVAESSEPELTMVEPDTSTDAPPREDTESAPAEEEEEAAPQGFSIGGRIAGEYRHRFVMLSDFPLEPMPRTDPAETGQYGANFWGEQWLRLRGELELRPILRLVGEVDLLWGVAYGDLATGQGPAAWTREDYGYPGLRLRQLYLEWLSPIGVFRVGQMAFSWGLGMVSNGGGDRPVFGDYRYGDLVRRVLFATKPAGRDSPFTLALAGDWVAWDLNADSETRGDQAFQGVLAGLYEEGDDRVGAYVAYRNQENRLGDTLQVFVGDVFAELHFDEPSGGRVLAAAEVAYVRGETTIPRTVEHPVHEVEQLMAVARLGRVSSDIDVILEGGYASGDSNAEDAFQRRATFDPDRRVGLILFPEVLSAMSARSAALASSPELFGRPSRGAELLPTNGGVSGAYYLFPYAIWRPLDWLEARVGAVISWTSTDLVDPFAQRARSRAQNFRGGDPTRRDLGLELDGSILLHGPLAEGVRLSGGVEGGVLFPGRAFDDGLGNPMDTVGLLRLRLGLAY